MISITEDQAVLFLELAEENGFPLSAKKLRELIDAPSPAGVDGLEVVAWMMKPDLYEPYVGIRRDSNCYGATEPLCRLSDAQAIIDGLRGEVEVMTQNANNYSRMFEECAEERDQQTQRIGELEQILRDLVPGCKWRIMRPRIDAALSELPK